MRLSNLWGKRLAALALAVVVHPQGAASEPFETCAVKMETVARTFDGARKTEELFNLAAECQEYPEYQYALGQAYIIDRKYDEAIAAFQIGLKAPGNVEKELKFGLGSVELHRHNYAAASEIYLKVTEEFPDWHIGHDYLGFALFADGALDKAQFALERANSLQEYSGTYRTLTLVYYSQGNHEKAVDALNRGYSLDESLLADRDFVVAGIRSYTDLGKFDIARGLLAALLHERPAIRDDEEFLRAGFYLREKMVQQGLIAE